jgi:hypothetical protein
MSRAVIPSGWESIPGLLRRFTNMGSVIKPVYRSLSRDQLCRLTVISLLTKNGFHASNRKSDILFLNLNSGTYPDTKLLQPTSVVINYCT